MSSLNNKIKNDKNKNTRSKT